MSRRFPPFALLAPLAALAACQAPPPRISAGGGGPSDPNAAAYCRQQAEDVYNAQNRGARFQTDNRDSPFSGAYSPNTASRGLSDRYAMDNMVRDCMRNSAARQANPEAQAAPTSAPTSAPAQTARPASRLSAGPAGGPPASSVAAPAGVPLERAPPPPPARP